MDYRMTAIKRKITRLYSELLQLHGSQGWWPLIRRGHNGVLELRYHSGPPRNSSQRFEIAVGAILTQNTSWEQAQRALLNLAELAVLEPKSLLELELTKLKRAIRPSGYYNRKARALREFARFYLALNGKTPSRQELLACWGIGKETADSILLYAYGQPTFVIDAYTRRIVSSLADGNADYDELKELFESALGHDVRIFQEFHALLVKQAKSMRAKSILRQSRASNFECS